MNNKCNMVEKNSKTLLNIQMQRFLEKLRHLSIELQLKVWSELQKVDRDLFLIRLTPMMMECHNHRQLKTILLVELNQGNIFA